MFFEICSGTNFLLGKSRSAEKTKLASYRTFNKLGVSLKTSLDESKQFSAFFAFL